MISKLLIANRGEIVVRIARTCREMGIATATVFSDPDRDALHVRSCDEAVALGGAAPGESYLRGDAIVAAAERVGADAVHPGFGFLAENAGFARAVIDAGLTWVGPNADAIESMGDKLRAKELMVDAGVPLLPSVEVGAAEDVAGAADDVGYPLLVKAAAGGGGKGMRIVRSRDELEDAVAGARREAASAFGDERVFLERYVTEPRHVEFQVLGDHHGDVLHLFERECSIQRRYQKVVEETPSPAVDHALREEMGRAAVAAARAVDYDNAGTVEFILGADGEFAFLEMNTRLQVEHPVTEEVVRVRGASPGARPDASGSGAPAEAPIDLVRLQLEVAAGAPLPFAQDDLVQRGHAVEVRLYAEDPTNDYLPATGELNAFLPAAGERIRWDAGVEAGSVVSPHYDPMLAKVIAHGPTREEAARRLARALERTVIHGVVTNRDLLAMILRDETFIAGETTTAFLEERFPEPAGRSRQPSESELRTAVVAAALDGERRRIADRRSQATIPSGWRNNRGYDERIRYRHGDREIEVHYRRERDGSWTFAIDGEGSTVRRSDIGRADERLRRIRLEVDGLSTEVAVSATTDPLAGAEEVHVGGSTGGITLVEVPRFPRVGLEDEAGAAVSPMPGAVVSVAVADGDQVEAGDLLVVVEAMKMEHRLTAPHAGVVSAVRVAEGDQVESGQALVVVDPGE